MKEIKNKEQKGKQVSKIILSASQDTGITLVALVITIVILIILSTVTINALIGENGLITNAQMATLMTEFSIYKEEMETFSATKKLENMDYSRESLNAGSTSLTYDTKEEVGGNIQTVIPSLDNKYVDKFEIIKGELLLNTTDGDEMQVAMRLGIEVNPYEIVDGVLLSSNTNLGLQTSNGTITIPDSVREIGAGAFSNVKGLKTVIIPGTVKRIGTNAFTNNSELEKVILEEGVEVIGAEAFKQCTGIKSIELPESLVSVEQRAFSSCENLDNVKVPSKITIIEAETFNNCQNLTNITFPENLQEIRSNAFLDCKKLDNLRIPKNVSIISSNALTGCLSLSNIEILAEDTNYIYENGMLMEVKTNEIIFISNIVLNNINTFIIPEGITNYSTNISTYGNITEIIIPKSLEKIGNATIFPKTISNVQVTEGNTSFVVENNCLYNGDKTELIMCFTKECRSRYSRYNRNSEKLCILAGNQYRECSIRWKYNNIKEQIFWHTTTKIKSIYIGAGVTSINTIFKYMNYYGTVTVDEANPNYSIENNELYNKDKTELLGIWYNINGTYEVKHGVTKIGDGAFTFKINMAEVILPDGLKEIGNSFNYCTGLTEIYIPNSVEKIGTTAFNNSSNLQLIKIDKEPNTIDGAPWGAIGWDRAVQWLR